MPVTKSDLIEQLSARIKLPRGKAESVVNLMFDRMSEALKQGQRIEIRGFGSFEVRNYKAYEGRNPRTGEPVHVGPKKLPFFKVGKELRERINRSQQPEDEDPTPQAPQETRTAAQAAPTAPAAAGPETAQAAHEPSEPGLAPTPAGDTAATRDV